MLQSNRHSEHRSSVAAFARWPVSCAALAALTDCGLTEEDIGRYFDVPVSKVRALQRYFGIREAREEIGALDR